MNRPISLHKVTTQLESGGGLMTYEVLVSEVPKQRVAAIRAHTTISGIGSTMGAAYGELYAHLSSSGVAPVGPPMAVYSEVDEVQGVTVEMCVPCPNASPSTDASSRMNSRPR